MPRPKGLDHVGLKVADMDRSVRFYQQLGLTLLRVSEPDAKGVRSAVIAVGGQELNLFARGDFIGPEDDDQRTGVHHFCINVEAASADELIADVREAGLTIVRGPVERKSGTSVFVCDPDGIRIELRIPK